MAFSRNNICESLKIGNQSDMAGQEYFNLLLQS